MRILTVALKKVRYDCEIETRLGKHISFKVVLLLAVAAFCLFEFAFYRQSEIFREYAMQLLSAHVTLMASFAVWYGTLQFLSTKWTDWLLTGLLLDAITAALIGGVNQPGTDLLVLLFGATLGKGFRVILFRGKQAASIGQSAVVRTFLQGLVILLASASWWHQDTKDRYYHGARWTGLWNNPNDYGLLMGAGVALAIGLLAVKEHKERKENENRKAEGGKRNFLRSLRSFVAKAFVGDSRSLSLRIILLIAAGMMGVGLLFSYSRGAWVGAVVGLLYLAKAHGKFKWRFVLPGVFVVAAVVFFFWNATSDTGPWYLKRIDLSRPSAQHRVAAWKAGFEIMRDHPFGVGWNKAVDVYEKNYSPPEGGAAAITTNDYLMLGTQLGLPGLLCFVAYVAPCLGVGSWQLGVRRWKLRDNLFHPHPPSNPIRENGVSPPSRSGEEIKNSQDACATLDMQRVACRAGALAMLVAFWFDGGLFKLATAAVFWILLELGASDLAVCNP